MTFDVELGPGEHEGQTRAVFGSRVVADSRTPLKDAARALIDAGADTRDVLQATRDGRFVARHPLAALAR